MISMLATLAHPLPLTKIPCNHYSLIAFIKINTKPNI